MPRFIAVHTLPFTVEQAVEKLNDLATRQLPAGGAWMNTWCDFDGHKFFCEWEAPSKEVLVEGFEANQVPFDAIHPVRHYDPTSRKLEAAASTATA
ncbi:MAG: DUF4242 domain-containing protein [Chloroflexi bacterium]|nr:DUF4242 domain-containing protein [Chloroflexota bacterium]